MTPFSFGEGYLSTTPAPLPSIQQSSRSAAGGTDVVPSTTEQESEERDTAGNEDGMSTLTPQITPFARKLRAGGFGWSNAAPAGTATVAATPGPSVLRSSVFGRSVLGGTAKSVRFAGGGTSGDGWRGSRVGRRDEGHEKSS